MVNERVFQLRFGVFVLEVEEFENERIFDRFFRRDSITRCGDLSLLQHGRLVSGEGDTFIKLALNLAVKLAD